AGHHAAAGRRAGGRAVAAGPVRRRRLVRRRCPAAGGRSTGMSHPLAKAGVVSFAGAVLGAGVNLGLGIVVGRGLGPEGTGTFFQVVAIFLILSNILELGADTGLVRFCSASVATGRSDELRPLVRIAVVPVAVTGAVLAVAAWILAPQ